MNFQTSHIPDLAREMARFTEGSWSFGRAYYNNSSNRLKCSVCFDYLQSGYE